MKNSILILCFILPFMIQGQNFDNICSPGYTFYRSPSNHFSAFRRDSVYPQSQGDTILISYRAIVQYTDWLCMDTSNGSILGRKIMKTASGWFYFFNLSNDTIKINAQAVLNQSWKFCSLPSGAYIQATYASLINDTVMDTTDDVKVITLQAKDASNLNISHPLNGHSIRLSRHYGLSVMLYVPLIPNDTASYSLAGKSTPARGVQNLTWQEIYNFQPGDEFHSIFFGYGSNGGGWRKMNTILSRTDFTDSVRYSIEECGQNFYSNPPYYSRFHDTVSITYSYNPPNGFWLSFMPNEFSPYYSSADAYQYFVNQYPGGRRSKFFEINAYININFISGSDTCWYENYGYYIDYEINTYTQGLGLTYHKNYSSEPPYYWEGIEELVYYKKGTETWGTPIAPDCDIILGIGNEIHDNFASDITVFPNPMISNSRIIINRVLDNTLSLLLYDFKGILLRKEVLDQSSFTLCRQELKSGLYLLVIQNADGTLVGEKKLMVE